MNYKYTLICESLDGDGDEMEVIFKMDCLSREGVEEELLRKMDHSITKYEGEKEAEAQAEYDRQMEEKAEMEEEISGREI